MTVPDDDPEHESFEDEDEVLDLGGNSEFAEEDDDAIEAEEGAVEETPLVTEAARVSMQQSLETLAMLAEPGAKPQIVRSGETSLEGLARDLLRPMLADWLDKNWPPMVERMVAAEISRIIGKRG